MKTTARINSELTNRQRNLAGNVRRHTVPMCKTTGLARYRDRHQARQGAETLRTGGRKYSVSTFACPDCRGYHLEKTFAREPIGNGRQSPPTVAFTSSLASRKRRYVLFDVENPTRGAKVTREELAVFWSILKQQAPGIAPNDHVVIGASRRVVQKYCGAINDANVKWVVGADAPDGADRALLAAIDLYRVSRDFDELVIISGDHAFAQLARRAKAAGLTVHVVTADHPDQSTMLSRELSAAADIHTRVRLHPRIDKRVNVAPIIMAAALSHRIAAVLSAAA